MYYSDDKLNLLRLEVAKRVSDRRFSHIRGVERCARRLASMLIPERESEVAAAAILHDVTKELPIEEHIRLIEESGFSLTEEDRATEGVLHSFSAPIVIKSDFPLFATPEILSAVMKHTVGSTDMTVMDKIVFLSDYIEDTRTYPSSIAVRNFTFDSAALLNRQQMLVRLNDACIRAIDGAYAALCYLKQPINSRMLETRHSLIQ